MSSLEDPEGVFLYIYYYTILFYFKSIMNKKQIMRIDNIAEEIL